jgi:hypothetical protein
MGKKVEEIINKWAYNIAHGLNQKVSHTLANPNEPCHENVGVINNFCNDLGELQKDALELALKETGDVEDKVDRENPARYGVWEVPSIKVTYHITINGSSDNECEIDKETTFYGLLDLCRIPSVGDDIGFDSEGECVFRVNMVIRAQAENEIIIFADHAGHDGGLVCDKMIKKHGFKLYGI